VAERYEWMESEAMVGVEINKEKKLTNRKWVKRMRTCAMHLSTMG